MEQCSTTVGLDVSKEVLVFAVLPVGSDQIAETGRVEYHPKAIQHLVSRLKERYGMSTFVYEAGPCGYELQRQLTALGQRAVVVAPALIPVRPGDRVKTDRRDAEKLARLYRAGELTVIRVPTREEEAARDLVRAREDVLADRLRARHRLSKFLLRQGRVYRETKNAWGVRHALWLKTQRFDCPALQQTLEAYVRTLDETQARLETLDQQLQDVAQQAPYRLPVMALRCLKGIDTLSALTLMVETQDFRRFPTAPAFMDFTGLVSSEHSSGSRVWRGSITKTGNAHLRRVLIEAAWCNRHGLVVSRELAARRKEAPPPIIQIARKAQMRLHRKYWRLIARGKAHAVAVTAVARELAGFVWAIGHQIPVGVASA